MLPLRLPPARLAILVAVVLTIGRSLTPIVEHWLNSDEALIGLMALHLVEGRAVPLFLYSLPHMLGITSWMAAPFVALGGPTAVMLKLPILLVNIALVWLLVDRLHRDARLSPAAAVVAALPLILAPPHLAYAYLLDASGGNPEPLLFALVLWTVRDRPLLFGTVLAIAVLNRPFAGYAVPALVALQVRDGSIRLQRTWWKWLVAALAASATVALVYALSLVASPRGPGTSFDPAAPDTVAFSMGFVCVDLGTLAGGAWRFASDVLPYMVGAERPLPAMPYFVFAGALIVGGRLFWLSRRPRDREPQTRLDFPLFLTIVGVLAAVVYVGARCGVVLEQTMRYALLTPFAFVGVLALVFCLEPRQAVRRAAAALVCAWAVAQAAQHVPRTAQAIAHGSPGVRYELARFLDSHDIRYAWADYWDALVITYLSGESVIVASDGVIRIAEHQRLLLERGAAAPRISRRPCAKGVEAVAGVYWVCMN